MSNIFKILFALILALSLSYADDDKTIMITKETQNIPNIQVIAADGNENTMKIYKMLVQDLRIIGHFNVYYDDTLKGDMLSNNLALQEYKAKNINFIAQVSFKKQGKGASGVLTLLDFATDKRINIESSQDEIEKYPFISHAFANYLNEYIKAPDISWINRYVIFSSFVGSARNDIVLADYTYSYQKTIISNGLNIFPKWADSKQTSFYYTRITDVATIYKYNLYTGESEKITQSQGMAVVSDVSRDDSKLLMSLSPNNLSDVYLYDVRSKNLTQLTNYSGIDVNAHFTNNDKSFVFVSDRLGYPNVFMQDLRPGASVNQVVFQGRNNSSLSTFGQYIVYSSRETDEETGSNVFNLYLVSSQSDYARRLSRKGVNKIPQFSGDGDSIMYLRQERGENAIGIIRLSINKSFLFPLKSVKIQAFDW
ncbi:Tol-Pal system protein TolB [Helicobacter saguini]|uniref:Tol-Pal system protein TolB n=1 Tax=Helicobacter saguini TaxID=1548018 RepID=A0A347VPN8_9HELI|nr:Tol-Pal system protein TolB [Helicobacter saguini]MWV61280.1 Tol-Pal system protein TolB [Helicobacter saguini]MWV68053.1 Tol-Pal system protein TolB [Helicobacter saguini]MWV70484.1 Tol-Pal system protein TolB [Helicobacter saguini]MWV72385.1 Tol-Pal system protein TolB [Helicobacter saguini]TLD92346.1 Tol-Pal system protein TolB [Helicobacter saguini]